MLTLSSWLRDCERLIDTDSNWLALWLPDWDRLPPCETDCDLLSDNDFHALCDSLLERDMDWERDASLDIPLAERDLLIDKD